MKENLRRILNQGRYVTLVAAITAAVSVTALHALGDGRNRSDSRVSVTVDQTPVQRATGSSITSFAPVVREVSPSVVTIATVQKGKRVQTSGNPFMEDPFWGRFFGGPMGPAGPGQREYRTPDRSGLGSGVIISKDGYILTNNHVVQDADEVEVRLADGRKEYTARVIGTDPKSDIAVLKIDETDLPALTLGDSDQIEIGDLVLAVGNPFGIGQTTTMGLISATGRGNMGLDYEDFIQTDAAINPGNSGGALVDVEGRLIGINTAIISRTGGNQGIGFAVPINLARSVMESLIENGRVIRGYLGVNIQDVNQELAEAFELETAKGALVAQVAPGSPAENAGLKNGDVIVEFDGREIRDTRHLKNLVGQTEPGAGSLLKVVRDGKVREFKVEVAELKEGPRLAQAEGNTVRENERLAGVGVGDIDREARQRLNLPRHVNGALVISVDPDSAAFRDGLREGDVILEIDRKEVASAAEAVKVADEAEGEQVLLRIWSRGATRWLVVNEAHQS